MQQLTSFSRPREAQDDCVLFKKIPAEVRDCIYGFALSYYDDSDRLVCLTVLLLCQMRLALTALQYPRDNPYWRPDCIAPPKVNCALLQTCQSIYNEAWFRPWASMVHKLWLTSPDRAPNRIDTLSIGTLAKMLQALFQNHGRVETQELQVFPQLYALEGGSLEGVLSLEHLYPLNLTITIRHTDWWFWEHDERLHIEGGWLSEARFPDSLKTINLELESLVRKTNQIDYIADQMADHWHFLTKNGTVFTADKAHMQTSRWNGGSTWNGERWIRDEVPENPERLDFYIKKITWLPDRALSRVPRFMPRLDVPDDFKVIQDAKPALRCRLMATAGVPAGADANEARRLVSEYIAMARPSSDDESDDGYPRSDDTLDSEYDYNDGDDGDSEYEYESDAEFEL